MSTIQTRQLEIAHAFLTSLNASDFDALADLLSPDFTHTEYCVAASLDLLGEQVKRGKQEMLDLFKHAWLTLFEYIKVCAVQCSFINGGLNYSSIFFFLFQFLPPIEVVQGSDAVVFHVGFHPNPRSDEFD